jgi:hypothetical protein
MELQPIQSKIYTIRGFKVMIDSDLAEMYGIETKVLKQAVRRNMDRFEGDDFMFELTSNEVLECSRSQFVTLNRSRGTNVKYAPFAFTELGVSMLSSVLNSKIAIEINRGIMRAFVAVRQSMFNPPINSAAELLREVKELKKYLDEVLFDQNDINEDTRIQLELINQTIAEMQVNNISSEKPRKRIGFNMDNEVVVRD